MAEYTLKVRRFQPEATDEDKRGAYWDNFDVELDPTLSVLDGLLQARDGEDGSLAVRCSCRAAICGSCGVKINGQSTLACKTQIGEAAEEAERKADGESTTSETGKPEIVIEPMGNMPVIKDLVVDMESTHWEKYRRVTPWLMPSGPPPEREYIVSAEAMVDVTQSVACIQCGSCVSACLSMEADPDFIGPAALAKAYRFVGDPRDGQTTERLYDLANDQHGIYDCTHCCASTPAPRARRADEPDHEAVAARRPRPRHPRRQQRPQPRARLRQEHREEGRSTSRCSCRSPRAGHQGQAAADDQVDEGPDRVDSDRDPRIRTGKMLGPEADPPASTTSFPATPRTTSSGSTTRPRRAGSSSTSTSSARAARRVARPVPRGSR